MVRCVDRGVFTRGESGAAVDVDKCLAAIAALAGGSGRPSYEASRLADPDPDKLPRFVAVRAAPSHGAAVSAPAPAAHGGGASAPPRAGGGGERADAAPLDDEFGDLPDDVLAGLDLESVGAAAQASAGDRRATAAVAGAPRPRGEAPANAAVRAAPWAREEPRARLGPRVAAEAPGAAGGGDMRATLHEQLDRCVRARRSRAVRAPMRALPQCARRDRRRAEAGGARV